MRAINFTTDTHPFLGNAAKRLLIDGQWVPARSGRTFESLNPADESVLARIAEGDAEDVDLAVAAARRAFDEGPWRGFKPYQRQRCLLSLADLIEDHLEELAWLDSLDMGGPVSRILTNGKRVPERLRYYAGMAVTMRGETIENSVRGQVFSCTVKEPVGVVGAIIPWNNPIGASMWKIGPALATGCTVVLKPAEEASLSALRLGELILDAGVPPGVVNIITGFGETAGAALAAHAGVDKLSFTGSHLTGRNIVHASAGNLKRLALELGGKSPDIVFADADLDAAVPGAAMAIFANSGQICSAGSRLFVQRPVYDEFVRRVADYGKGLRVGRGTDTDTQIGPLVSKRQVERVTGYLNLGTREGATVLSGGSRLTEGAYAKGYFVPPTVFAEVRDDMRICQEEIFGPVVCAIPFDTEEEAIKRANATPFGLGSGVWTRDVGRAFRLSRALRAGSVWVNCYQLMDPAMPFGGYKMSGYGRESGLQQLEEYLQVKALWVNTD
ncbi:MAG: aldehyde dehydrogenase family protein [Burkholderiales bacterium]|nr:aldehyde dehydrogenase family protein [Burkholderiales bacterium]